MLPQSVSVADVGSEGSGNTKWPVLSPEVAVGEIEHQAELTLPQAWKAVPADFAKNASRARLKEWLGPQSWKLDKGVQVQLIEVFAGRARLSDEFESAGGVSIRVGRAWGQELRGEEARWLLRSLVKVTCPKDVFIAFPCKSYCRWSQYNLCRSLETRQKILRERLASRSDLDMVFEIIELQSKCGRYVTRESKWVCSLEG